MTEAAQVKKPAFIIRGRAPFAIVFMIRFIEAADAATKALAEKYATTVGKIDDIRKNRNFAYVTEDVKFTQAQIDEAKSFIEQHEDKDHAIAVIDKLDTLTVATAEEAEAFANVKRKAGGQSRVDADGKVMDAGGGNRQNANTVKKGKNAAKAEAVIEETLAEAEARIKAEDEAVAAGTHDPADLLDI